MYTSGIGKYYYIKVYLQMALDNPTIKIYNRYLH